MRIGLIDVDSHNFPNIALMKLSAWHKHNGDVVEFVNYWQEYDRIYMSKVFTNSKEPQEQLRTSDLIKGGTGYKSQSKLYESIESTYPDYSLYPLLTKNTAYGFLTRGCPRMCSFCIVSEKEGDKSNKVADIRQFWKGQKKIKLLDPNILACIDSNEILKDLIRTKAIIDFTQGLDARLLNEDNISLLKRLKFTNLHFAWDNINEEYYILPKLQILKHRLDLHYSRIIVYVLCNYKSTFDQDYYRVMKLKENGMSPYIMIYDLESLKKYGRRINKRSLLMELRGWCNQPRLFNRMSFNDFLKIRRISEYHTFKEVING